MALEARMWKYTNKTLVGNWLEDRDQAPPLDTTQRVTPKATSASTYETSASAIGVAAEVPRGPRPVKSMLAGVNFLEAHAPRSPANAPDVGGYDATLPRPVPPVSSYETTYARFHELDPAADARVFREQADDDRAVGGYPASVNPARPDEPVARDSRAFFGVNATRRDFYDDSERDAKTGGGRSGARGPLTRHAEECGARNASSVWADEFAEAR